MSWEHLQAGLLFLLAFMVLGRLIWSTFLLEPEYKRKEPSALAAPDPAFAFSAAAVETARVRAERMGRRCAALDTVHVFQADEPPRGWKSVNPVRMGYLEWPDQDESGPPTAEALAEDGFQTYAKPAEKKDMDFWRNRYSDDLYPKPCDEKLKPLPYQLEYDGGMTRDEDEIDRIRRKNRGKP